MAGATMTLSAGGVETGPFDMDDLRSAMDSVKAGRMKPDPDFAAVEEKVYRVTAAELRQFVERIERLEAEKKAIAEQAKEVFAEAKGRGYDVKVLKKLIALRRRKPDDVREEEAVLALYREALGC